MKKWLAGLLIIIALGLGSIYFFIPTNLIVSKVTYMNCNADGAYRVLSGISNWQKWWPGNETDNSAYFRDTSKTYIYSNDTFHIAESLPKLFKISIIHQSSHITSFLVLIPLDKDSMAVEWRSTIIMSANPITRIIQYNEAKAIKDNMAIILMHMGSFLQKEENVYGMIINKVSIKDTSMVSTKAEFTAYPSTADIYNLINILKKYIAKSGADEINVPIMNVTQISDRNFELMVAIPINKKVSGSGNILYKKMIPGNFLEAEVKGGNYSVEEAFTNMNNLIKDYEVTTMAIPFEQLITDRTLESDTSKWITKIYQPAY